MEKYSKAVSEMYSQFKQREVRPMEKYVGRLARCRGEKLEVAGYSVGAPGGLLPDSRRDLVWRPVEPGCMRCNI